MGRDRSSGVSGSDFAVAFADAAEHLAARGRPVTRDPGLNQVRRRAKHAASGKSPLRRFATLPPTRLWPRRSPVESPRNATPGRRWFGGRTSRCASMAHVLSCNSRGSTCRGPRPGGRASVAVRSRAPLSDRRRRQFPHWRAASRPAAQSRCNGRAGCRTSRKSPGDPSARGESRWRWDRRRRTRALPSGTSSALTLTPRT